MTDRTIRRLVREAVAEWGTVRELARRLGVGETHVHRLLADPQRNRDARPLTVAWLARILVVVRPGVRYRPGPDPREAMLRQAGLARRRKQRSSP